MKKTDFESKKDYYLENISGLVVIDMEGTIRYVNRQCSTFFRAPDSNLIGQHISKVFPQTKMLENLDPSIVTPRIVFYKSDYGTGISMHVPLMEEDKKIGLLEYDLIQEDQAFYELTDQYNSFLKDELNQLRKRIVKLEGSKYNIDHIIGSSPQIVNLKQNIRAIAKSPSTVLITGETGTGKELVSHAIHKLSDRSHKTFAKINASVFPENLVESELFGYEKGAFTGANKEGKIGKFEYANKGTLFIDEIQEMPLSVQPKLLRTLQEKEIEPIGSNTTIPVDVRIIAASNQDLKQLVKEGKFRSDLYYRLNVIHIQVPPLRDHLDDLEELITYHIAALNQELGSSVKEVDPKVITMLRGYNWPGNIRELKNVLERAITFSPDSDILKPEDFYFFSEKKHNGDSLNLHTGKNMIEAARNNAERQVIEAALVKFNNNKSRAADYLGISRPLLYQKLKRLGIKL